MRSGCVFATFSDDAKTMTSKTVGRGGFPQSVLLRSIILHHPVIQEETFHGEINEACSCLSELFLLIERSRLIQFGIAAVYEESFGVKDI